MDLVVLWGSKITFVFVWIEVNSIFVARHLNRFDIRSAIEIDFISVMGSK